MRKNILVATLTALTLIGCTEGQTITPAQDVQIKNPEINNQRILGFAEPMMRTYMLEDLEAAEARANGSSQNVVRERIEVTGLTCVAENAEFRSTTVTPGYIQFPVFKGRPTTLQIRCAGNGYDTTIQQEPKLSGVMVAGPSPAGLIAAAVSAGVAASNDKWSFGADGTPLPIMVKKAPD